MAEEKSIAGIVGQVLEEIQKRDVRTGGQPGSREENSPPADKVLRVALGCDHGGYEAKELLKTYLGNLGYRVTDVGTHSKESVDYPDFALQVARKVAGGQCERGIMIDGAGIGSSIVCNKVHGIRAAACHDEYTTIMSRSHNDTNVLCLGGRVLDTEHAVQLVRLWLRTPFEGGRHQRRVDKIMAIEKDND